MNRKKKVYNAVYKKNDFGNYDLMLYCESKREPIMKVDTKCFKLFSVFNQALTGANVNHAKLGSFTYYPDSSKEEKNIWKNFKSK